MSKGSGWERHWRQLYSIVCPDEMNCDTCTSVPAVTIMWGNLFLQADFMNKSTKPSIPIDKRSTHCHVHRRVCPKIVIPSR